MNFKNIGIDSETRVQSNVPFPVADYYKKYKEGTRPHPFVEGYLKEVTVSLLVSNKAIASDGVELEAGEDLKFHQVDDKFRSVTLNFVFEDKDGNYTHLEKLWSVGKGDKKFDNKTRMLLEKVAHIFNAFVPGKAAEYLSHEKLETEENKYTEAKEFSLFFKGYFEAIANAFNTLRKEGPVYKLEDNFIPVRIKLVRKNYGARPNQLQLGLGNCVERIQENKVSILTVGANDKFELIETTTASAGLPGASVLPDTNTGAAAGDIWPDV